MIHDAATPLAVADNYPSTTLDRLLSVAIVNWNTRDLLAQCLQSILADCGPQLAVPTQEAAHQPAHQAPIEIFVVDNASSDGSVQMLKERFPWVRLIENTENLGFARANNQAIAQTNGRYILLLNSDTIVHSGAFAALTGFMERTPKAGAAGAYLLNGDGTRQIACYPMMTPWREFLRLLFVDRVFHVANYSASWWDTEDPRE
jgi:GT2 family glycosyltransferase